MATQLSDRASMKWGAAELKVKMFSIITYLVDDTHCTKEDVLQTCCEILELLDEQDVDIYSADDLVEVITNEILAR